MQKDPEEILTELNIDFEDKGDYFLFKSPFRNEKTASCVCYKNSSFVSDFGGPFRGHISVMYKEMTGRSLYSGQDRSKKTTTKMFSESSTKKSRFERQYSSILLEGEFCDPLDNLDADAYCRSRGITSSIIEKNSITYCTYGKMKGEQVEDLPEKWVSLTKRLCIPIFYQGKIVSIEGRDITRQKEKKVVYPKGGSVNFLFNYDELNRNETLYIVEGLMDLFKIQSILKNVTSVFGVQLTNNQKEQLNEFRSICIIPDNDEAGYSLVDNIDSFYKGDNYEVVIVPKKDPGECSLGEIKEALKRPLQMSEFMIHKSNMFSEKSLLFE